MILEKGSSGWYSTGDYRRLNQKPIPGCLPVASHSSFDSYLISYNYCVEINLIKTYKRNPMASADIPKAAIITPLRLYEFSCMPFCLENTAQTFQRFIRLFVDDYLIACPDRESHSPASGPCSRTIEKHGITVDTQKCQIGINSLDFLGHTVYVQGIRPLKSKVAAIMNYPEP